MTLVKRILIAAAIALHKKRVYRQTMETVRIEFVCAALVGLLTANPNQNAANVASIAVSIAKEVEAQLKIQNAKIKK